MEINYMPCTRPELSENISEVLKPFMIVIKERNLTTQVNQHASIPTAFYIEKKIYCEILYNLFQNAVKYNKPNGQIVTTVRFDAETCKLWTTIEDTGVGIKQSLRKNLFIAFRNSENQSSSRHTLSKSGIGIGLSNSKCLVEALGGTIDLQSKLDKGTIVTFSIDIVLQKERTERISVDKQLKDIIQDQYKIKQTTEGEMLSPEDFAPDAPAGSVIIFEQSKAEDTQRELIDKDKKVTPVPPSESPNKPETPAKSPSKDVKMMNRQERQQIRALERLDVKEEGEEEKGDLAPIPVPTY